MHHLVTAQPFGTIDLDLSKGCIFFQQTWHYEWLVEQGAKPWTYAEKKAFHDGLDHQIWRRWSYKFLFRVVSTAPPPPPPKPPVILSGVDPFKKNPLGSKQMKVIKPVQAPVAIVPGPEVLPQFHHQPISPSPSPHVAQLGSTLATRFGRVGLPINFDVRWELAKGNYTVKVHKYPRSVPRYRSNVDYWNMVIELDFRDLEGYTAGNDAGQARNGFETPPHEFGHAIGAKDEYVGTSPHIGDTESEMNIGHQVRGRHLQMIQCTLNAMLPGCQFVYP
jgi:hypothetical protein